MYFVDIEKLEARLTVFDQQIHLVEQHPQWETLIEHRALERIGMLMIESVLDVGNAIIDGFIMRDPGSYQDIVDILLDEKVIHSQLHQSLGKLIVFRKQLMQDYGDMDIEKLKEYLLEDHVNLAHFPKQVREFMLEKMPPYHAFRMKGTDDIL